MLVKYIVCTDDIVYLADQKLWCSVSTESIYLFLMAIEKLSTP